MFKQVFIFLFIGALSFSATTATVQAQSADFTEALKRMDQIIVQMQKLRAEFATLSASMKTAPTPAVLGAQSQGILGSDVAYGSTNDDIRRIQALLATDPTIYSYGVASGYFGPKTQEAIRLFQSRYDLDTVGVIGPATRALLEVFFAAYPSENYPSDVLKKTKPTIAVIPKTPTPKVAGAVSTPSDTHANVLKSMNVDEDDDEYIIRVKFSTSRRDATIIIAANNNAELIEKIAAKLNVSEDDVKDVLGVKIKSKSSRSSGDIDIIEVDVRDDDARVVVEYDGKDNKSFFIEETRRDDIVEEIADELGVKEGVIEDVVEFDYGDIEDIYVAVNYGSSRVTINFESGLKLRFTVDEDDENDIIEAIADKIDAKENDVDNDIEFD